MFNSTLFVPLFFAGSTQLNIQVPWELNGQSQATLALTIGGITYRAVIVDLVPYAPGIFTINGRVKGQGDVVSAATGQIAAPAGSIPGVRTSPASKGDYVTIYCTGLGDVTNRPASGAIAPSSPSAQTKAIVTAKIGNVPTPVTFAGLTGERGLISSERSIARRRS